MSKEEQESIAEDLVSKKRNRSGPNCSLRRTELGGYAFSLTQTDMRFALCKESLLFDKSIKIGLKGVYGSLTDIELCGITKFNSVDELSVRYSKLNALGYGGKFVKYDKKYCPEGALFPFVRFRGLKNMELIDEGCIWIGNRFEHPRVFVANEVANWLCPYSPGGFARIDPFRPYFQVIEILPKLMNKYHYPDIDLPGLV